MLELLALLFAGGFPLRKCSHPEALSKIPDKDKATTSIHLFEQDLIQRELEIFCSSKKDKIQVRAVIDNQVQTMKQRLSILVQVYDPLDLLAPAILTLKLLL